MSSRIIAAERIPTSGFLLVPGRLDLPQLQELQKHLGDRKITYLIEENDTHPTALRDYMERSENGAMFSTTDKNPAAVGKELNSFIQHNGILIFVPGQATTRLATPIHIPSAHLKILTTLGLPILPLAIDCPKESPLAIENPNDLPESILAFGEPIAANSINLPTFQQNILAAFETAYSSRKIFQASLATALLKSLINNPNDKIVDGSDDVTLPFSKILPVAIALSKYIREETDKLRVAIILPPGKAGLIANLAVIFAGKIPVNLNFTASHDAVCSAIEQADLDRFITADPFVRKLASFPWPPNRDLIFIERTLPTLKSKIITWAILGKILPSSAIKTIFKIGKAKGDDEAILLFTSGSSGDPKGVALSHRNVLANVCQFASRLNLHADASILGSLPLFHSFGCTVTLWFPIIEGLDLVTYPNPLDTKRLAQLIAEHQVTVLLATPTFLRGYIKRVDPEQLKSLKLVVTGAEKLPDNLANAFRDRFGISPFEGYGLTETSPATNVNLPDPTAGDNQTTILANRLGSVGQLLPGVAVRLTNPATDELCELNQQGIIWLKGANVFHGYLDNQAKTDEVLTADGWFRTGDVGRVDDDGFLFIEGRISRFSKIAGEMVPHETVEAAINKALGLDNEAERKIAVVGIPDAQKGEAILLLSSIAGPALDQECIDLRYKLLEEGVPSIWCPKAILPVKEIPVLASGKLDLKSCQDLANA